MTTEKPTQPAEAELLQTKINLETAQIGWRELQRFFAAGKAVAVDPALDLTKVAAELAKDNRAQFEHWLKQEQVAPVSDEQAETWYAEEASVWAVVVAPWVLVQPISAGSDG